mmetsp:Transcript_24469/g.28850  ORF Transcript_24469/g.28850 Transcript_24469/m.28850 type:complete len:213 (+) Transcript_24469:132-770(+)
MIDAQESPKGVQADIETAANAIQSLAVAKEGLLSYISYQEALMLEKKSLEYIVKDLGDEKQQLESEVEKAKKDLHDLKSEFTETQNEILNQTYATKALSTTTIGMIKRNEEKQVMYIDKSSDESSNYCTTASLPRRLIFGDEDVSFQCREEEPDIDSLEDISTTRSVPNILKNVSTSARKRLNAKKFYWSPKKWRRMVRTHRLQSIIIENTK